VVTQAEPAGHPCPATCPARPEAVPRLFNRALMESLGKLWRSAQHPLKKGTGPVRAPLHRSFALLLYALLFYFFLGAFGSLVQFKDNRLRHRSLIAVRHKEADTTCRDAPGKGIPA
jgi:hypothetical protein